VEASPGPWIAALRHSHDILQGLVEPLEAEQLEQPSYASGWSIAEVLSHIGSQSEIFELFLDAGLSGEDPPGSGAFAPIWEAWNARDPQSQATDALQADERVLRRFESLTPQEVGKLRLKAFGMELDATGLTRMRLGEHALHTWDVAVVLDPSAEVAPDAVALLVDSLSQLAERSGKYAGTKARVRVSTTRPERHFTLEIADPVVLTTGDGEGGSARLSLPAEAFVRLVYGRLDASHTPLSIEAEGVALDDLRQVFQGF
jgi:uncharacterized protein (TIGR03083 family)